MTTPFSNYAKIKDNFCIAYFGCCNEYLWLLEYIRPFIIREFPQINLQLACQDNLLHNWPNFISQTDLINNKNNYVYIKEIKCNLITHPIMDFIEESSVQVEPVKIQPTDSNICVIHSKGNLPTKSIPESKVEMLRRTYEQKGYQVCRDLDVENPGVVIGVENELFVKAALTGIPSSLAPTGVGARLYTKIFPNVNILEI